MKKGVVVKVLLGIEVSVVVVVVVVIVAKKSKIKELTDGKSETKLKKQQIKRMIKN